MKAYQFNIALLATLVLVFAAHAAPTNSTNLIPPSGPKVATNLLNNSRGEIPSPALLGKNVPYVIHAPKGDFDGKQLPMVVYMRHLPIERIGTTSDEELIAGFLAQGMLVAEVDYGGQRFGTNSQKYYDEVSFLYASFGAYYPHTPPYMRSWTLEIPARMGYQEKDKVLPILIDGKTYTVDPDWVYVVPEGYTVIRDIEVMKLHWAPPTDRVRMELIAPSKPKHSVPLVLETSTTGIWPVLPGTKLKKEDERLTLFNWNTPYPMSYALSGHAVAILANIYERTPDGKEWNFGIEAAERKAFRMLRARKAEVGLSGTIGMMGISKSACRALIMGAKRPGQSPSLEAAKENQYPYNIFFHEALTPELKDRFYPEIVTKQLPFVLGPIDLAGVAEERDAGPHAAESDRPEVIMFADSAAPGAMLLPYVTAHMPPMVYSVGANKPLGHRFTEMGVKEFCEALKDRGAKEILCIIEPATGHEFDRVHYDEILAFFDKYLKPENKGVSRP